MLKFIGDIRSLLLALWLGAACYFCFALAPSAFAVLPTNEFAGALVSRTLMILNVSGLVLSLFLLFSSFLPSKSAHTAFIWIERLLLLLVAIGCSIGQFLISFMMSSIRNSMGRPIDEVALDDPLKIQFNFWHIWSVNTLSGVMIAALLAYFILAYRSRNTANKEIKQADFSDYKV